MEKEFEEYWSAHSKRMLLNAPGNLRQEYLDEIRISFGNTLEHTVIERPDGTRVKLHKKQDLK